MMMVQRCVRALGAVLLGVTMLVPLPAAPVASAVRPAAVPVTDKDKNADELLIVLDTSGSMSTFDGVGSASTTRLESAKRALTNAVDAMPDESHVGLRVFGGECGDSRLAEPIESIDKTALKRTIGNTVADGGTPLAYALEQSAADFSTRGRKRILLVSDGEESCDGDPVAAAQRLASVGIEVCIDVIGFQVDSIARSQLTTIASSACGTYYDAEDGNVLASKLQNTSCPASRPWQVFDIASVGGISSLSPPGTTPPRSARRCS